MGKKTVTSQDIARLKKVAGSPEGQRVIGILQQAVEYLPDEEFQKVERASDNPVCYVGGFLEKLQSDPDAYRIDAKLYEYQPKTRKHRLKQITSTDTFLERVQRESSRSRSSRKLMEWSGGDFGGGGRAPGQQLVGQEYIQLLGGPYSRQLYWYDYLLQNALAFEAKNHNPVAKFIVSTLTDFTLGKGLTIECQNTDAQKAVDAFWDLNNMNHRLRTWSDELTTYGEIMIRKFMLPKGEMAVRAIDPTTVWEIVTDPDDLEKVYYYHQQYPTRWQMFMGAPVGSKQLAKPSSLFEYIIRQIPAQEVKHVKVNAVSNEVRGRSELFSVLGWLKRMKDYLSYRVVKAKNESAFLYDVMVDGSASDVAAAESLFPSNPEAGSAYFHNKPIEIKPMVPTVGRSARDETADWLLSMIAVGSRIPVEYFGIITSGGGSRASAIVGTEPIAKVIQMRQVIFEELVLSLCQDALIQAGIKGDQDMEVTFPEIMSTDRTQKITDVLTAEDASLITKKRAGTMIAKELQITNYDYDQEKKDIDAQPPDLDMSTIQLFPKTGAPAPASGQAQPDPGSQGAMRGQDMTPAGKNKIKAQNKTV